MNTAHFIIFAKDVQSLTGYSLRQAERVLEKIRKKFGRKKDHLITMSEFCNYCEFNEEEVTRALNKKTNEQ